MNIILVIAENPSLCESLRAALPESDLVLVEHSVEDALRRLIGIKADVIIIDDAASLGRQAIARMHVAVPETPLLALSGRSDGETLAALTMAGARATIPKPFSCDKLKEAVSDSIRSFSEHRAGSSASAVPSTDSAKTATLSQHQTALRWLNRIAGHIKDPMRLSQDLVDGVTDVFGAVRSAVLLEVDGNVRVTASHGLSGTLTEAVRLDFSSGLMRWLEAHVCLIDRETSVADPVTMKEMQVLGAVLAAPLLCSGRVAGAVLLGDRASGAPYAFEERELLTVVARCAATSLENVGLYRDVSRHQQRLDGILANVSAGVVVVSPERTIMMMNQSAERTLQVRAADLVGKSVQKLGSGFADIALRALVENKPFLRQEVRDPAIDALLGLTATPLGAEGVVVVFSKIPEEAASTEDIAYSPFWEYFATRVGQEVKNPLVAINTFAQLLPRKYESEDFRSAFSEVVQKEIGRINKVVEILFEFARHPRLALQRANVNESVQSVLKTYDQILRERAIQLETEWDPDLPEANLDPIYFSQALSNVVQNSIDAMPSGGKLRVRTRRDNGRCEVVVSDTGPGIAEQDAPLMFMPFFSTKEQGMGMGLTIANRILRQHEGALKFLRNNDGGSAFTIELPLSGKAHADSSRH